MSGPSGAGTATMPSLRVVGGFFDWWQIETPLGITCWRSDGRVAEQVPKRWRVSTPRPRP